MLYIAENLKALRKNREWTQEEMAEAVGVSPQSVSKWERGDTYPDITLLPALANLYKVSVDAIIGMDKINEAENRTEFFKRGHEYLRQGDDKAAIGVFTDALKTFPNDESIMSELALVLSFDNDPEKLKQAAVLCERVLSGNPTEKVRHTTRAAICFIYFKLGEKDKAMTAASNLPHIRESREKVQAELRDDPSMDEVNEYLRFISIGEEKHSEKLVIIHGVDMGTMISHHGLFDKHSALRKEIGMQSKGEGLRQIPRIMGQCYHGDFPSGMVKVNYCGEILLDKVFTDPAEAVEEIMLVLRKLAQR